MKTIFRLLAVTMATLLVACQATPDPTSPTSSPGSPSEESTSAESSDTSKPSTGETVDEGEGIGEGESMSVIQEVGRFLPLTAMNEAQAVLVNNLGMSGREGRNHVHNARPEDMYQGADTEWLFDIGHIDRVGEVYLWNYNAPGETSHGLRTIEASLSIDGEHFGEAEVYTLSEAAGVDGLLADGLEDKAPLSFHGQSGRYLKIKVLDNFGGAFNGLSEIRLFRYRQPGREGEYLSLSPVERFNNGVWSAEPSDYAFVNGSGLNYLEADSDHSLVHDNNPDHMYRGSTRLFDLVVDLQGQYPISEILLWNYNDPDHLAYGLKEIKLSYSHDMSRWTSLGQFELPQGEGLEAMPPSLRVEVDNVHAHYVRIEILSHYGGESIGLSEIAVKAGHGWYVDYAPDYTALLSNFQGWTGADGIYTVNLDGKDYDPARDSALQKTFFVFSDTITGTVNGRTDIRTGMGFINNSFALLEGQKPDVRKMSFIYPIVGSAAITPDPPTPATQAGKSIYYWLGDTFIEGKYLYVFALRIDSVPTSWGFEQIGVDLARYEIVDGQVSWDSLTLLNDQRDNARLSGISDPNSLWYFGGGVYQSTAEAGAIDPDGYLYIYGYNDVQNQGRQLIVARVLPSTLEDFTQWEYLDSEDQWVSEIPNQFKHLHGDVAPEISVSQIQEGEEKGKFLLVWQNITVSATIKAAVAASPFGVFGQDVILYTHDTTVKIQGQANTTYNAKAHPALSKPGELLITYNINGGADAFTYGDIYRPRFLRLATLAPSEGDLR